MVSFIIIGKNEGWKLDLCLKSVQKAAKENDYIKSEIIYVDSNSSDDSISMAKKFTPIRIMQLTKDCNPAIARNLGAKVSKGSILFFIDGDMEIESSFLQHVINQSGDLCYDFLNGFYYDYFYNDKWEFLYRKQNPSPEKIKHDYFEYITGGLFIISKKLWDEIGGMKEYLARGEDPDLALRLAKREYPKLRKNKLMGIHHTIKEKHAVSVPVLLNRDYLGGTILPYRENLFSIATLRRLIRHEYMALFLIISSITVLIGMEVFYIMMLIYFAGNLIRTYRRFKGLKRLFVMILKDIVFILGFMFYWPRRTPVVVEYNSIQ